MRMFKEKSEIRDFYNGNVSRLAGEIASRKMRNRLFVVGELAAFVAAVIAFVAWASGGLRAPLLILALLLLVVYAVVRHFDISNMRKTEHLESLRAYYIKETEALDGNYSSFDDGSRYADSAHPFSFDLDLFGIGSLFQRVCRCVTPGGKTALANVLSVLPHDKNIILQRQDAVSELTEMEEWRAEWNSNVASDVLSVYLSEWETPSSESQDSSSGRQRPPVIAYLAIVGFIASVVLAAVGIVPSSVPTMWAVAQLGAVVAVTNRPLRRISQSGENLLRALRGYIPLVELVDNASFKSPLMLSLSSQLQGDDDAMEAFRELRRILDGYDRRGNLLGMVLFNILFLSDYFLVRRYHRWRARYAARVGQWLDAISEIDSLVSMSTFRFGHPETVMPVIADGDTVVYDARELWHPFLGAEAVSNDFTIGHRNYYIITGANMAGKSTFLRSIGINYILAMSGMPVFASEMTVSVFNLFTSMRTTDDLQHGISYFNAELLRLKQLLQSISDNPPCTLIILDEILKGTNSLDKLNGSRMFLEAVSKMPVSGVIATHDLELSHMADDSDRFHNYCFEIELGESVTYNYKITPGVAKNQNATYLLQRILRS